MNKPVSGYLVFFALAVSAGLIWLGMAGVDIGQIARAFFGAAVLVVAGGVVFGFIAALLRT